MLNAGSVRIEKLLPGSVRTINPAPYPSAGLIWPLPLEGFPSGFTAAQLVVGSTFLPRLARGHSGSRLYLLHSKAGCRYTNSPPSMSGVPACLAWLGSSSPRGPFPVE